MFYSIREILSRTRQVTWKTALCVHINKLNQEILLQVQHRTFLTDSDDFLGSCIKCWFGKLANLDSITRNNCRVKTCSTQLHRHIDISLNTFVLYVNLLLKYVFVSHFNDLWSLMTGIYVIYGTCPNFLAQLFICLLYTSPSPRDQA